MDVHSSSISFVFKPIAFVDISVGMDEFSLSRRLICQPVAFVYGAIGPYLLALAIS
jgi:hypothetical protein